MNIYMAITSLSCRKNEDDMLQRECERHEYRRKKRKERVVYPAELRDENFHIWFPKAMLRVIEEGADEVQ